MRIIWLLQIIYKHESTCWPTLVPWELDSGNHTLKLAERFSYFQVVIEKNSRDFHTWPSYDTTQPNVWSTNGLTWPAKVTWDSDLVGRPELLGKGQPAIGIICPFLAKLSTCQLRSVWAHTCSWNPQKWRKRLYYCFGWNGMLTESIYVYILATIVCSLVTLTL